MKKSIAVVVTILFLTAAASAQKGFHVGLDGDFNSVWIVNQNAYGNPEYDYKLDLGGGGGLVLGYNFTNHFGFQAEVKSSKQGQKYVNHDNSTLTRDVNLHYLAVPLLVKIIGGSSGVKFYADAGVQYNSLSKATLKGNYYGNQDTMLDAKPRFNSSDLGFTFGLGADISFTDYLYMNVGMSFVYSFSDINAKNGTGIYSYPPPNGNTWQWPDKGGTGVYKASRNGTGGFSVGLHYLFSTDSGN